LAKAVFPVRRKIGGRWPRIDLLPYALAAPAVIVVFLLTVYPALYAVRLSLTDANLMRFASAKFVGLKNYFDVFQDHIFIGSLLRTARWVFTVSGFQMLVALPVAMFLNKSFRGRGAVRAAVLVPYIVPGAVVAIIWRFMLDSNYGVINDILVRLGAIEASVPWMSLPTPSFVVMSTAMVWSIYPFCAITLLASLQAISPEFYEATRVDGGTSWQQFRYITFPILLPTILLLLLLSTIWLSHGIDLIFMMSGGGPGYSNYTVAVYSFLLTNRELEIGYPSALAVMLSFVLLLASVVYIRFIDKAREWM